MQIDFHSRGRSSGRIVDRFREGAAIAASNAELHRLVEEAAGELGFDHFALVHHAALRTNRAGLIRIDNYPAAWAAEMDFHGLAGGDPVHLASLRTHAGFSWSEVGQFVALGPRERSMFERASSHGIGDGFTVPANVPGEPSGSVSFAVRPGRRLPGDRLLCAEQVGLHAFKSARRINDFPAAVKRPRLSPRERQCVRLVAAGKTDWEIAAILGISIETAHQYIKRARAAYGVVSRAQLAACGLRDAIVSFDEALPPQG